MKRFWEPRLGMWQVTVLLGEYHVSRDDEVISTVLGSCISACVRDVKRNVGGINHFLLPRAPTSDTHVDEGAPLRYGVAALEGLINSVLRGGGDRKSLEVKVFGGGRVIEGGSDVGRTNIAFVKEFFATEGIPISSADVGGTFARRLRYWPKTGRAQVLQIPMAKADQVVTDEKAAATRILPQSQSAGSVELF